MKRLIRSSALPLSIAGALSCSLPAAAEVYLVDFNANATSGYPAGSTWNAYAAPANVTGTLVDSDNNASTVSISATGTFSDSGNGTAFQNPGGGAAWATSSTDNTLTSAVGDYFFTSTATAAQSFTVSFAGLTAGDALSIDLFASRAADASSDPQGFYTYSVDGGTTWQGFRVVDKAGTPILTEGWDVNTTATLGFDNEKDGNDKAWYMTIGGVTLPSTTLQIRVEDDAANATYSVLNAIRVTTTVPEPASLALTGIGALLLAGSRRRRQA